jgi:flagellar hook protein FlgE
MSFQQALSGLNATSKNLQVIGHNIANANTFGAKVGRAEFADVYATSLNGAGSVNVGIGVNLATVAQQFTQGSIKTTDNPLDLAINGQGFFQVSNGKDPISFTRNGQFKVDRDGYVVTNSNERLQGYPVDDKGVLQPGSVQALQLPTEGVAPSTTSYIKLEANLDARLKTTGTVAAPTIDFNDAVTYNNATSLTVYDLKGQEVALTYYFQKAATDTWNVFATANGVTVNGTNAAPAPLTTITFAINGSQPTSPLTPVPFTVPSTLNAAGAVTMAIPGVEFNVSALTQYGAGFGVTDMRQDGFAAGQLTAMVVETNGVVTARYSNGQTRPAGQVELATFRNPQGLQPMGDNLWGRTYTSGDPIVGIPGDGNLGVLQPGALEESNIDLTGELVSMITAQRIYQANAQTLKTEDQLLQTLVNLR